ncbi:MAG: hypothetical protein HYV63_21495 [Candidatus Schekmanbacteria bacterium]|nr:hypothetical protein [Candidatus Schekmanbacteria bacterium]
MGGSRASLLVTGLLVLEITAITTSSAMADATWSATGLDGLTVRCLTADPANGSRLVAGTLEDRLFLTTNGGDTWFAAGQTLPVTNIQAVAVDPQQPMTVYAGTATAGVYKSTDYGGTWVAANDGVGTAGASALAVDPLQPMTVYAGTNTGRLVKSTDAGASWAASDNGLEDGEITAVLIDPTASQIAYVATRYAAGVYKSTNGGGSWNVSSTGLADTFVSALVFDPAASYALYAGTDTGVFKSTDGGSTWAASSVGLGTLHVQALAVDPVRHEVVYAGTEFGGVFASVDSGASWFHGSSGLAHDSVESLAVDPVDGQTVWAGTRGGGVYRRLNDPPATPTPTSVATPTLTATPTAKATATATSTPPLASGWRRFGPWYGDALGPFDGNGRFWLEPGFDDRDWQAVVAAVGGPPVSLPVIEQGIDYDLDDRYFRASFAWDGTTSLWVELASDDGLSVYINGSRLGDWGRWREPGCVNLSDLCTVNTVVPPQLIPADLLVVGQNVIAINLSNGGGPDYRLHLGITSQPSAPAASWLLAVALTSAILGGRRPWLRRLRG